MADVKKVIEIIDKIIADVDEQKLFLTELDNVKQLKEHLKAKISELF